MPAKSTAGDAYFAARKSKRWANGGDVRLPIQMALSQQAFTDPISRDPTTIVAPLAG